MNRQLESRLTSDYHIEAFICEKCETEWTEDEVEEADQNGITRCPDENCGGICPSK
jgi:uncharacterized Zn ribbon protein